MKNTEFFVYVKDFLERYQMDLKSSKTLETYKNSLEDFKNYLIKNSNTKVEKIGFTDINDDVVREYLKHLIESGKSLSTRNIRLIAIRQYLRFCAEQDIEITSLFIKISRIKSKLVRPKKNNWLSRDDVKLLADQCCHNRLGIRDRMIIIFLFMTGARLAELINCKLRDLSLAGKDFYVVFNGKGNKTRLVPINNELYNNLKYYLSLFHKTNNPDNYLFYIHHKGHDEQMSEDNIQRILKKYGDLARKINPSLPQIHPHLLRHSFGAINYRAGMSLPELAKLMGHDNLETTEIYAETDFDMVKQAVQNMTKDENTVSKWDELSEEDKSLVKSNE